MNFKTKKLFPIGDLHIGHPKWMYVKKTFENELINIWDSKGDIFLMGDLLECQTRNSVGKGQIMDINKQLETVIDYFKDFAKAGRLIGMISGNHEDRINKDTGNFDLYKDMCNQLNTKPLGRSHVFEYNGYYIYAIHPRGAATTDGGRDLWFKRLLIRRQVDIYLVGHFHSLYNKQHTGRFYYLNKLPHQRQAFCTGSILHYELDYVEERAYEPMINGYWELDFLGDQQGIVAKPHYLFYERNYYKTTKEGINPTAWYHWEWEQTPQAKQYRKQYDKQYYENNKQHIKQYYENNKQRKKQYRGTHIYDVYPISYECYHCHTTHQYIPRKSTAVNPATTSPCGKTVSLKKYFQIRERTDAEL